MIDSNLLIEYFKGNEQAKSIIEIISDNKANDYLLSIDTIEEILYILVRYFSKKPYWELKNNPKIVKDTYSSIIPAINIILNNFFTVIDTPQNIMENLFNICKDYGLLPKDALIVSLALNYNADSIISLDKDLKGSKLIKVVSSSEELKQYIS
jgi:predicted nucleic acid-binding protein